MPWQQIDNFDEPMPPHSIFHRSVRFSFEEGIVFNELDLTQENDGSLSITLEGPGASSFHRIHQNNTFGGITYPILTQSAYTLDPATVSLHTSMWAISSFFQAAMAMDETLLGVQQIIASALQTSQTPIPRVQPLAVPGAPRMHHAYQLPQNRPVVEDDEVLEPIDRDAHMMPRNLFNPFGPGPLR